MKQRRRPRHLEDDEQAALFRWAAHFLWRGKPLSRWMFAVPNGGKRDAREAARLKRQGVRAGVFDIFVHRPAGGYAGLFLELKVGKNRLTDNQKKFEVDALDCGYWTATAWGWLEAKKIIMDYLEGNMPSKVLDEIRHLVGVQGALEITRRWGGRRLYVPANMHEMHPIALAVGQENAQALSDRFMGQQIEIPGEANILLELRNELIVEARGKGKTHREIARRYGISERMVRKIVEKAKEKRNESA